MLSVNMDRVPRVMLAGFVSYKSPWTHFRRTTDEHILYIVKSGELHIKEAGRPFSLRQGDVLMLEPHLEHEGFEQHACDYYYIHFKHPDITPLAVENHESFARAFFREDREPDENNSCCFPKSFTLSGKPAMAQIIGALNEMLHLYRRKNYNQSLTALRLSELFVRLSREYMLAVLQQTRKRQTKSILMAHELLDYIHQHYQTKITSEQIEREFRCNFDYLNRTFNKLAGYSIAYYVNKVRIDHARELLGTTGLSVGEIAHLIGFSDIYHFSKVFKKYTGASPTVYGKGMVEAE